MDSLRSIEVRNSLSERFELRLAATLLYDYPTVERLGGHLLEQLDLDVQVPVPAKRVARRNRMDEPIAIVSMACRFPGGIRTPEEL